MAFHVNPYAHEIRHGIRIVITARIAIQPPEAGLEIASAIQRLYPAQFQLAKMDRLLVNRTVLNALIAGQDPKKIVSGWQANLQ